MEKWLRFNTFLSYLKTTTYHKLFKSIQIWYCPRAIIKKNNKVPRMDPCGSLIWLVCSSDTYTICYIFIYDSLNIFSLKSKICNLWLNSWNITMISLLFPALLDIKQKFEYNTFDNSLGTLSKFEGKKFIKKNLIVLLLLNSIGKKPKSLKKWVF